MRHKYITSLFVTVLASLLLCSCWREDLSQCWKGDVILSITAERFGELPDKPAASDLGATVSDFQYYLFNKNGNIADQGSVDVSSVHDDHYDLVIPTLPFGEYTLALTANTGGTLMNAETWQAIRLECPETSGTDYFTSLYTFTLDCECGYADIVKLYRSKGIVDVRLEQLPSVISRARVDITPVSAYCLPDTTYEGSKAVWAETLVTPENGTTPVTLSLDAFPNAKETLATVTLTLYMPGSNGEEIIAAQRELTQKLQVVRNQRMGISVNFNNSIASVPGVTITLNPDWDGINGDTDIDIN